MDRHHQLMRTLRGLAPIFADVCRAAQDRSSQLGDSDWADRNIYRSAILHRLVGTARWGFAADGLLERETDVARHGMFCTTTYEQQNQGRYYWHIPDLGVVFTVRREAHPNPKDVAALQLQIEGVLETSMKSLPGGALVVYLAVPPAGSTPRVEITRNGNLLDTYTLQDLLDQQDPPDAGFTDLTRGPLDPEGRAPRRVRSAKKPSAGEEDASNEQG